MLPMTVLHFPKELTVLVRLKNVLVDLEESEEYIDNMEQDALEKYQQTYYLKKTWQTDIGKRVTPDVGETKNYDDISAKE